MIGTLVELARPLLLTLDPERAHDLTLAALERGIHPHDRSADDAALAASVWGLDFPNPIGIAAGFDKNARVPDAMLAMGCGFAEIGTVTPLPQPGNPRPRVFRLIQDRAVINRLGFNNEGHAAVLARLARRQKAGIVGVNIGANKDSADRATDYVKGLATFNRLASYFTVNVSSPNTPGLRDLQAPAALDALLSRIMAERRRLAEGGEPHRPIVVKLAPDLADDDLPAIVDCIMKHAADGIAVSNTTLARTGLQNQLAGRQAGGLSGRPLFVRSTRMLARVWQLSGGKLPLIGIGGIESGETALAKIAAGATLIQLYTGLVYEGAGLIARIKRHLSAHVHEHGHRTLADIRGSRATEFAAMPLEPS